MTHGAISIQATVCDAQPRRKALPVLRARTTAIRSGAKATNASAPRETFGKAKAKRTPEVRARNHDQLRGSGSFDAARLRMTGAAASDPSTLRVSG
jgi:hypothetical protein